MNTHKIIVATFPDEDGLVVEIWFDFHFATLFFREGEMKIEFYSHGKHEIAVLSLKEVTDAIEAAKLRLLSYKSVDNEN